MNATMPPPPPPTVGGRAYPDAQVTPGWAGLGTGGTVELASPWARLGARIIDWLIVAVVVVIVSVPIGLVLVGIEESGDLSPDEQDALGFLFTLVFLGVVALAVVASIVYEVAMIAVRGQTLGKMAAKVKVVRADNGFVPGWGKSFGRSVLHTVVGSVPFFGLLVYLSLTWDEARQGWHDKAASTLVVKA